MNSQQQSTTAESLRPNLTYTAPRGCVDFLIYHPQLAPDAVHGETSPCTECLPWQYEVFVSFHDGPGQVLRDVFVREWHAQACPVLAEDLEAVRQQHERDGCPDGGDPDRACPSCQPHESHRRPPLRQRSQGEAQ